MRLAAMNFFFSRVPPIIQRMLPVFQWVNDLDEITLTFDDGPYPDTTPWLLDYLDERGLKATFFVVGEQAERHPDLMDDIAKRNHQIGNHGYRHLKGWSLSVAEFKENVDRGAKVSGSTLFRPPYGQIGLQQYRAIKQDHRVVMWSVMPGDFVEGIDIAHRMIKINESLSNHDIIVMHDNPIHFDRTREMLGLITCRLSPQ